MEQGRTAEHTLITSLQTVTREVNAPDGFALSVVLTYAVINVFYSECGKILQRPGGHGSRINRVCRETSLFGQQVVTYAEVA